MKITRHVPVPIEPPPAHFILMLSQEEFDMLKRIADADDGFGCYTLNKAVIDFTVNIFLSNFRVASRYLTTVIDK